jgi:hypothetical protein
MTTFDIILTIYGVLAVAVWVTATTLLIRKDNTLEPLMAGVVGLGFALLWPLILVLFAVGLLARRLSKLGGPR